MKPTAIRKVVKEILAARGLSNRFQVRGTNFTDLARDKPVFVLIHGWKPDPIAEEIQREIRERTGAVTQFYQSSPI